MEQKFAAVQIGEHEWRIEKLINGEPKQIDNVIYYIKEVAEAVARDLNKEENETW
jgi:hypothetical protein